MLHLLGRFLPKLGPCLHGPFFLTQSGRACAAGRGGLCGQNRRGETPLDDRDIDLTAIETAYSGFFHVERYRLRHRRFSGDWSDELSREVFRRRDAAAVLLYDPPRDLIVLVEQFRLPAHLAGFPAWQIEIVAGLVDDGESAEEVARREAREEAGLAVIGPLLPVQRFLPSPGGSTETVTLFCGFVDAGAAGGIHGLAEENEDIRVVVKPADEAIEMAEGGAINNAVTLLALQWFAVQREALRRRWDAGTRSHS